ncbi:substrate-binding domain-containing protein [bacterium]|nr:substrate-binding domain-containing protein [bacterium]
MAKTFGLLRILAPLALAWLAASAMAQPAAADALRDKWCKDVKIRFFVGGSEGDSFATIVYNGARQAQADTGAQVDFVFSGWSSEKMVQQLREAIAAHPDGIAMMGHPGPDSIMPLAEEAFDAGILMMYQNVDVPSVRARFGGGYIGANLSPQGYALGQEAVRMSGIGKGDKAIVLADWSMENRVIRELGTVKALEDAGVTVIKLATTPEMAGDPNLAIPVISAGLLAHPDVKLIAYPGGQMLGNAPTYMQVAGKKPGEIFNIGFDTSAQIVEAFKNGWVQLTSDQQPFLQGYMPILSLCQQKVYGLGALNIDTGAGFVTKDTIGKVADLAVQGLR